MTVDRFACKSAPNSSAFDFRRTGSFDSAGCEVTAEGVDACQSRGITTGNTALHTVSDFSTLASAEARASRRIEARSKAAVEAMVLQPFSSCPKPQSHHTTLLAHCSSPV